MEKENLRTLVVDVEQKGISISPYLYGIFFEDINFAGDGGIYPELISNRSFENFDPFGQEDLHLMSWEKVGSEDSELRMEIKDQGGLFINNPYYLDVHIDTMGAFAGIKNKGYHDAGFAVKKGEQYHLTLYMKSRNGIGTIEVLLHSRTTTNVSAQGKIDIQGTEWKKYELSLIAETSMKDTELILLIQGTQSVSFDFISLFPKDTYGGRKNGLRPDMVEMLKGLKPRFLRFPGGCIVEGRSFPNMYRWKETIGAPEERKTNWNRWQLDEYQLEGRTSKDYFQTYGLGYFEYFLLSKDLGATPMPIMNIGMTCQWHESLLIPLDELDPFIQDILDLIEFANGDETTTWGKKRIELGHTESFDLKYIGIGNEQWGQDYFDRYERCHRVIKEKYPEIQLITSAGWTAQGKDFDFAMDWMKTSSIKADLIDEHYYAKPQWFLNNVTRYDNYDRNLSKVFAGEYACHLENRRNAWEAALVEAAVMTGFEKNSDHVWMTCYAPLFGKIGHIQWYPNLLWFDDLNVYGTPSYYVQQLFSQELGDRILASSIDGVANRPIDPEATWSMPEQFHHVVSYRDSDSCIIIKAVNTSPKPFVTKLELKTAIDFNLSEITSITLQSDELSSENSLEAPMYLVPKVKVQSLEGLDINYEFLPFSVTVLKIK